MYQTNADSFNFKPLTLYSFFPKNKRLKIAKQDSNIISKEHKTSNNNNECIYKERNNLNKATKKNTHWNFATNSKTIKFNGIASSTSNNFYNHKDNYLTKKYSINYNNKNSNNYKYDFHSFSNKKNKIKEKNRKQERIKSVGEVNYQHMQNIDKKEINEKFLEQFLDDYDSKLQRNMKDIKVNYSNSNNYMYINNIKINSKNHLTKSSKNNRINNEYMNSVRFKNIIRLNNEKIYNYLPYLKSASKDKKLSPKSQKQLLVYGNYNVNTINTGFNPANGSSGYNNMANFFNNMHTLTKNNYSKNNSNKKNNFLHVSSNPVISSFNNNNITTNSNISNTGNNNIIFNNVGSIGSINNNVYEENSKKNNFFEEINRTNTAGGTRAKNFDYNNILKKKNQNNIYDIMKFENHKINEIDENIENKKNNNNKEKIVRNFNFLKENKDKIEAKDKEREKENSIQNNPNIKVRAFSTAPYKTRNKNKKTTINIDCKRQNNDRQITNENMNSPKNNNNDNKKEIINNKSIKKDRLSKYEIGNSLGKGAYATVKLVTNKLTQEKFAMKIYEKEKLNSNSKKSCVYKEIQILKKLKHKNIVKLIEVISTEKQILIVQELIEGISLREYYNNEIRNQKGISIHKENIFRTIFKQIFEAMDYVHRQGMAHRDIKLENILIKKNYEIKIIDFGFGMYNPENKLQKFFCGTPNYMPPEIAEKKPYVGQLADMWSLGILVYKIFCADFPFKGKDEKELYKAIKTGKFTMASYTPDYARKIICSLIVLNPNKRLTCEDVLNSDWLRNK